MGIWEACDFCFLVHCRQSVQNEEQSRENGILFQVEIVTLQVVVQRTANCQCQ